MNKPSRNFDFIPCEGEMARLIREKDWAQTTVGTPDLWPQSLRTMLGVVLYSRFPMFIWWGPELVCFYNDAYRPSLGTEGKHPSILGMPAREAWAEIWPVIEPLIRQVCEGGHAIWSENQLIPIYRNGRLEDVYWTFSYSRISNDHGKTQGVLVTCVETTQTILARQKLAETADLQFSANRVLEGAEERARLAVAAGNLGTFDLEIDQQHIITSERFCEIFDISPDAAHQELIDRIHPDDVARRHEAYQRAMETGHLHYEVRVLHRDGSIRWVRADGRITKNAVENKPARLLGTVMDITDHKEQERKREEYIAIASHELRNPLTTLKLSLDMLSSLVKEPGSSVFLNKSREQVKRLISLTGELLNVSRISSGELAINPEVFHLGTAISESIATVEEGISSDLFQVSGNADISIVADRFRIEQVLVNLLTNAVKYSPKGSPVFIDVQSQPGWVIVSVRDKGIGIDEDKIPMVFRKFSRVETGGGVEGYGLGLYISEQIIRRHGGEIGAQSEKGKGSTFWFRLPY